MLIKTSVLTGLSLDFAVALANGKRPEFNMQSHGRTWSGIWLTVDEYTRCPDFSNDWVQGGLIIEREGLTVGRQVHKTEWSAEAFDGSGMSMTFLRFGPTPLIAAMRCYVASKLGDKVYIPDELLVIESKSLL